MNHCDRIQKITFESNFYLSVLVCKPTYTLCEKHTAVMLLRLASLLSLRGPTQENLVLHPIAALSLNNRLCLNQS